MDSRGCTGCVGCRGLRLIARRERDAGERVWQVWTLTPLIPSDLVADPVGAGGQGFHVGVRENGWRGRGTAWMNFS